jgi:transcriptional regulator GlxA family with amidase domain
MQKLRTGILIFENVEVLDFAGPYEIFSRTRLEPGVESRRTDATAPFEVFTVARTTAPLRAVGGLQVVPDHGFDDCPPVDVLVVPGGFGTRALLDDEAHLTWIRERASEAAWVTAVCTGALLLAKTGLLRGKRATTHWCALDLLASIDDTVDVRREERFVHDGVVTSAGVAAGMDMAFSVVEKICGKQVADETAHYIEYQRGASPVPR